MAYQTIGLVDYLTRHKVSVSSTASTGWPTPSGDQHIMMQVTSTGSQVILTQNQMQGFELGIFKITYPAGITQRIRLESDMEFVVVPLTPEAKNRHRLVRQRVWHWHAAFIELIHKFGTEFRGEMVPCYLYFIIGGLIRELYVLGLCPTSMCREDKDLG